MMSRLLLWFAVLLSAGCSTMERVTNYMSGGKETTDPPAPLIEFSQRLKVIELWSRGTGGGTEEQYLKLAPIIANQHLYIADFNGDLLALDATNGTKLWSKNVAQKKGFWSRDEGSRVTGGPGYGEQTILLGTNKGNVLTLSAETGKEQWSATVSSEILSAPRRASGTVVVRTIDGKLFALDADSGRRLWIYERSVPNLTLRGTSSPVIFDNVVICGFDEGRLIAVELRTGKLIWEVRITTARGSSELDRMVDIDSEPVVVNGVIYVATYQGHIAAVQLENGRIIWNRDLSSYAGFSVDNDNVYVTDEHSHVLAFDRFSGTPLWEQKKLHARKITAPAAIGNYLVVGDYQGYLHWMSKDTGNFVARNRVSNDPIIAHPIVVGKFLYAFCSDGELAAYTYR